MKKELKPYMKNNWIDGTRECIKNGTYRKAYGENEKLLCPFNLKIPDRNINKTEALEYFKPFHNFLAYINQLGADMDILIDFMNESQDEEKGIVKEALSIIDMYRNKLINFFASYNMFDSNGKFVRGKVQLLFNKMFEQKLEAINDKIKSAKTLRKYGPSID